jgi:hypothetical protein
MGNAITLAQFHLSEAVRLADAATVSQEIDRAEALRKWLLTGWTEPEIMVRDVVRLGPNPLRESPKARAALVLLERHGWIGLVPLTFRSPNSFMRPSVRMPRGFCPRAMNDGGAGYRTH